MALRYDDACDAILSLAKVAWDAEAPALNGMVLPVLVYENIEKDLKPHPRDTSKPWARLVIRHVPGGSRAAALGQHRFRRTGIIWCQVFVPYDDGLSIQKATALARIVQKAYEVCRGSEVSFKDVTVAERGPEGTFYRVDCTANFWWDEIR
jgi:hypothetical protein